MAIRLDAVVSDVPFYKFDISYFTMPVAIVSVNQEDLRKVKVPEQDRKIYEENIRNTKVFNYIGCALPIFLGDKVRIYLNSDVGLGSKHGLREVEQVDKLDTEGKNIASYY
jgi:hypothetical protein